jgi:hypothetical protein
MEFNSPRFAGDAVLEEILNDPDTGTKKLQSGSPADSVRRVQQALFDMGWSLRIDPPVFDEAAFVDGDYGRRTTDAALAYKKRYDIHFPPNAPTGFYDGFTGPRTLQRLDQQSVLFDESGAAIEAKAQALQAGGVSVQLSADTPTTVTITGTHGVFRPALIAGANGAIFHERTVGAFEVHGAIFDAYMRQGNAAGPLGFPVGDEQDDDPGFRRSDFQNGSLRCDLNTGVVELIGAPPERLAVF